MKIASDPKGYENFTRFGNLRKSLRRMSVSHHKSEVAPVQQALKLKQMQTQNSYEDREKSSDAYVLSDTSNDENLILNQPQSRSQPESTEGYKKSNKGGHSISSKGNSIFQLEIFGHFNGIFTSCNYISNYFRNFSRAQSHAT